MAFLSGEEFRKRFSPLFDINPLLTNGEAYAILKANSFDLPDACLEAARKVPRHEKFWIPQRALNQLELDNPENIRDTNSSDRTSQKVKLPKLNTQPDEDDRDHNEDSDDESESDFVRNDHWANVVDDFNNVVTGLKRKFSTFAISDESDADTSSSESESESDSDSDTAIDYHSQLSRSPSGIASRPQAPLERPQNSETRTTQWVSKIAGNLFGRTLEPVKTSEDQLTGELALTKYREAISQARNTAEEFLRQNRVEAMEIEYRAGDDVLVKLEVGSDILYARIVYLFEDRENISMAHIRYFKHGSETIIGELASPRELFLTTQCGDVHMTEVKGKIVVEFRGKSRKDRGSGVRPIEEEFYASADRYFYRLQYDILSESFTRASKLVIQEPGTLLQDYECCAKDIAKKAEKDHPIKLLHFKREREYARVVTYRGKEYRLKDFVYFVDTATSVEKKPYCIGQIQVIQVTIPGDSDTDTATATDNDEFNVKLRLDVYERYDDHFQTTRTEEIKHNIQFAVHDERRLFFRRTKLVSVEKLDGHCIVLHRNQIEDLNAYKDLDDTFWVQDQIPCTLIRNAITVGDLVDMPEEDLKSSRKSNRRLMQEKKKAMAKKCGTKLSTLDIFSGAGGLSQGFHESGVVGTTYAIEFDTAACKSFKRNFPDATVYNGSANDLLEWVVKHEAGLKPDILYDKDGNQMPRMPSKGEIDMIIGGPPCQGWSDLNRHKKPHCGGRELIATYLSYVDFYRPKYFLLENVPGLVRYKLNAQGLPDMNLKGVLVKGAVKFIFRVLTSLGYQCQYASLQAGAYGSPSSRTRVIFWASLPGHKLPEFPQATHIFNGVVPECSHLLRRSAPLYQVTIGDCLADLPSFEWINTCMPLEESCQTKRTQSIPQYSILRNLSYIGQEIQEYASPPLCEYQRKIRNSVSNRLLHNHATSRPSTADTERICNVPLQAGAYYIDIPRDLLVPFLRRTIENWENDGILKSDYKGRYGRQSVEESFKIVTTKLEAPSTTSWTLHPYLHRQYSAREFARAQGFPDNFTWDLETTKMSDVHRQIGNAVPIPLARALANELWKVLPQDRSAGGEIDRSEEIMDQDHMELDNEVYRDMTPGEELLVSNEFYQNEDMDADEPILLGSFKFYQDENMDDDEPILLGSFKFDHKDDTDDEVMGNKEDTELSHQPCGHRRRGHGQNFKARFNRKPWYRKRR